MGLATSVAAMYTKLLEELCICERERGQHESETRGKRQLIMNECLLVVIRTASMDKVFVMHLFVIHINE